MYVVVPVLMNINYMIPLYIEISEIEQQEQQKEEQGKQEKYSDDIIEWQVHTYRYW